MTDERARVADEKTVLVVEDEESFVEALTIGLSHEGFRVEVARDGAEALQRFGEVEPDLVLLDLMLPKVSGLDVCRELRLVSQVPIIMVTAKGDEVDTVVGLEVGAEERLKRAPRGFETVTEPDLAAAVRNRHFAVRHQIDPAAIHKPAFADELFDFTIRAKSLLDWGREIEGRVVPS